jgi:hypothetical protein
MYKKFIIVKLKSNRSNLIKNIFIFMDVVSNTSLLSFASTSVHQHFSSVISTPLHQRTPTLLCDFYTELLTLCSTFVGNLVLNPSLLTHSLSQTRFPGSSFSSNLQKKRRALSLRRSHPCAAWPSPAGVLPWPVPPPTR